MKAVEPLEVEVGTVHDIESSRFGNEHIEDIDVVQFAVGDVDKTGNRSTQVEQYVQFDRRFGGAKLGPRKQREARVDSGGIQSVDRLGTIHTQEVLSIQAARGADKHLSEFGIDTPVAPLVGVGQGAATHRTAKTHVIEFGRLRAQTRLDVSQTFAVG
jgi:hypothetical protein